MKRFLKWTVVILLAVVAIGLCAFLYNIPPFFLTAPEEFGAQMATAPPVTNVADPAERLIAERGRSIVMRTGCIGCHALGTTQGPVLTQYLAG